MKKTRSKHKKNYRKKKRNSIRKGRGIPIIYHDDNLWAHQNVSTHRDRIGTYPEIKSLLSQRLNSDLARQIMGASPNKSLHPFLREDIQRLADKFTRNRNNQLKTHQTHKYKRK